MVAQSSIISMTSGVQKVPSRKSEALSKKLLADNYTTIGRVVKICNELMPERINS